MIARYQAVFLEACDERRYFFVGLRVGQAQRTIHESDRVGLAFNARNEARAKVKHEAMPP